MSPDVSSPKFTSTTSFQGRDSQARRATARVTTAQAASGEGADAASHVSQPGHARTGTPPFALRRTAPVAPSPRGHWIELKGCRVAGHVLPLVLLHPRFGIAIGGGPMEAAALVRQRLDRARFPAIFPGTLPVLRLTTLDSPAERAFAAVPPLDLPGGDAWVAMAQLALETEASPALPARVGIRARRRRQRHRMLLAGGLAFLLLGATGLGLALLTPEPSPLLATQSLPNPAPTALPPVPPPPAAAMAGPPAAMPGLPVVRPGLSPVVPAPQAPPMIPAPAAPSGLAAVLPAPAPLPPLPARPLPEAPAERAAPDPLQAEARPKPPPVPSLGPILAPPRRDHEAAPNPTPSQAERRIAPALQEARNLPAAISSQSIAGAQRCRLITQRIQIGDLVADADIRFLQRGCPD